MKGSMTSVVDIPMDCSIAAVKEASVTVLTTCANDTVRPTSTNTVTFGERSIIVTSLSWRPAGSSLMMVTLSVLSSSPVRARSMRTRAAALLVRESMNDSV